MPISSVQKRVHSLLASQRDLESFVARGAPINRDGPRFSADLDIFHDRVERVAAAAEADAGLLERFPASLSRGSGLHGRASA